MRKAKIYSHKGVSFYYDFSQRGYITILKDGTSIILHDSVDGAKWQIDWELNNMNNQYSFGKHLQIN